MSGSNVARAHRRGGLESSSFHCEIVMHFGFVSLTRNASPSFPMSPRRPILALLNSTISRSLLCTRCARSLTNVTKSRTRPFHAPSRKHQDAVLGVDGVNRTFFWANAFHESREKETEGITKEQLQELVAKANKSSRFAAARTPAAAISKTETFIEEPPHRRRKRLKIEAALAANNAGSITEAPLPPDASSTLSRSAAAAPAKSWKRIFSTYLALTKPRLAFLIVLTTTASYSIYPVPALLSTSATAAPSLSTLTLLFLTTGTFWCIASANTLNMLFEPAHDAKMSRTRNRPLVRGLVSKRAALVFAIISGVAGTGALWYGVNPTTALLGAGNIALYAFAYTPLKRIHPVNTWVGAVVGAIPPLMGWCAAASQYSTVDASDGTVSSIIAEAQELLFTEQAIGGWLIAALVFAWQFPHFFALSYGVRHEYATAGYKMLPSTNMAMASRVSLRYSLAMFPICAGLSYYQVTDTAFLATSSVINGWMVREAVRMWQHTGEKGSARALFWASVWQLPIVLVLAMVHKMGLWDRVYRSIMGDAEPELYEDEAWEEEEA